MRRQIDPLVTPSRNLGPAPSSHVRFWPGRIGAAVAIPDAAIKMSPANAIANIVRPLTSKTYQRPQKLVRPLVFFSCGRRERLVHSLSLVTRFRSLPEGLVSAAVDLAAHACPR